MLHANVVFSFKPTPLLFNIPLPDSSPPITPFPLSLADTPNPQHFLSHGRGAPHLRPQPKPMELGGRGKAVKKGPFIYSPYAKKVVQADPITWVEGDVVVATVVMTNPLSFPLLVQKMTLR